MWSGPNSRAREEAPKTHLEVEFTHRMRDALVALLEGEAGITESTKTLLLRQLKTAREIDQPLFAARLDWDELEAEAKRQGCDVLDVFWDRAGQKSE